MLNLLRFSLLVATISHMHWLSFIVEITLGLLASEAGFSTLEVVVLALAAFPTAFWELEILLVRVVL